MGTPGTEPRPVWTYTRPDVNAPGSADTSMRAAAQPPRDAVVHPAVPAPLSGSRRTCGRSTRRRDPPRPRRGVGAGYPHGSGLAKRPALPTGRAGRPGTRPRCQGDRTSRTPKWQLAIARRWRVALLRLQLPDDPANDRGRRELGRERRRHYFRYYLGKGSTGVQVTTPVTSSDGSMKGKWYWARAGPALAARISVATATTAKPWGWTPCGSASARACRPSDEGS